MDQAKIQMADGRVVARVVRATHYVKGQPRVIEGYCSVDGNHIKVRSVNGSRLSFTEVAPDKIRVNLLRFFHCLQVHLQLGGWDDFTRIENGVRIRYMFDYEQNAYTSKIDTRIISVKVVS